MGTLRTRLERARERLFVGRASELATLETLLDPLGPQFAHVQGMGGVGKTELLRACVRQASQRGWEVTYLDASDILPTAEALEAAFFGAGARDTRRLLVLDSFELLSAVERPLRAP